MSLQATSQPGRFVTIFDDTYNQPDCRAYYQMLRALGYSNHQHAVPVFRAVLAELIRLRGLRAPSILDFASSYGIVTALMEHEISAQAFLDRYCAPEMDNVTPEQLGTMDRRWLDSTPRRQAGARFYGVDVADNAVRYAQAVGLFEQGFAEDLQKNAPSEGLMSVLGQTDLIVECGSVAHLMPVALDRLLSASSGRRPWVVTSPVRGNERAAAFDVMRDHGLDVQAIGAPFAHRRFENAEEQARAIDIAQAAGHATEGFEDTGAFFAQVYVARPVDEAANPLMIKA